MSVLDCAGVLIVPSAVFAESIWSRSLRVGVETSESKFSVDDGASHWGTNGYVEAGEGQTHVCRFETKFDTAAAGSPSGHLSYVSLSGGFGTLTLVQVWAASYNATGAMTNNNNYYGDSETNFRHGSSVSYAFSNSLISQQTNFVYADGTES